MTSQGRTRWVILRDLGIFQLRLFMDGAKDVVLVPLSIGAAVLDLYLPGDRPGHRFYSVMRLGERYDRWLSLYAAAGKASAHEDGLFGASRAGASGYLGKLEELIVGPEEDPLASPAGGKSGA